MFSLHVARQDIHMATIGSVVSLVKCGSQSGIVDRPSDLAKPSFIRNDELNNDVRQIEGSSHAYQPPDRRMFDADV